MRLASVTVSRRSETISWVTYSLKSTEAHKTPFSQPFKQNLLRGNAGDPTGFAREAFISHLGWHQARTLRGKKATSTLLLLSLSPLQLINMEDLRPRTLHGKKRCPRFYFFPYLLLALR
jgi:hypothetical protein